MDDRVSQTLEISSLTSSTVCAQAFRPMSECAVQVIKDNGLSDRITVIPKRSTELTVGPGWLTNCLCFCNLCLSHLSKHIMQCIAR